MVEHDQLSGQKSLGPDSIQIYPVPTEVFSYQMGPSIATPIFSKDKLVVCGYSGILLFEYDDNLNFKLIDRFNITIESTPVINNGKIFIASKNGYLYCLGAKD